MEKSLLQILLTLLRVKLIFCYFLYPIPLTIFTVETTNFASTGEGKIFC